MKYLAGILGSLAATTLAVTAIPAEAQHSNNRDRHSEVSRTREPARMARRQGSELGSGPELSPRQLQGSASQS